MAASKKKSTKNETKKQDEVINKNGSRQLWAIILFALGFLILALLIIEGQSVWKFFHDLLFGLFGGTAFVTPPLMIYISVMGSLEKKNSDMRHKLWQSMIIIILICAAVQVIMVGGVEGNNFIDSLANLFEDGMELKGGGLIGALVAWPLITFCGRVGGAIIIFILAFIFIMVLTGATLVGMFKAFGKPVKKLEKNYKIKISGNENERRNQNSGNKFNIDVPLGPELPNHPVSSPKITQQRPERKKHYDDEYDKTGQIEESLNETASFEVNNGEIITNTDSAPEDTVKNSTPDDDKTTKKKQNKSESPNTPFIDDLIKNAVKENAASQNNAKSETDDLFKINENENIYNYPPVSLLNISKNTGNVDISGEMKANADKLVNTLKSFGVETRIVEICRGPAVTRYELQPSAGVKISKITNLSDDIALNLAAAGVRIEAPIPNKAAVGIEVPNKQTDTVSIREIIDSDEFDGSESRLSVALGRDIAGSIKIADIARMPHMLIAGATGSGKSVCINSIIISLLYKAGPGEIRLLLIDPKVVELGIYNGIPHLLVPVVTDPHKAAGALGWAVTEMLNRYKAFASNGVRDLKGFNELAKHSDEINPMPQIVIIIDELADLMMAAPNEVEDSICRLAQMARAAGMHLVIATQRPSVDVITGVIKANVPSRIAFAVSSQIDSRTILDGGGAEKLLGRGDMLFYPVGSPKPVRVQGCFVTDKEVEQVVNYIKNKTNAEYDDKVMEEIEKQATSEKHNKKKPDDGGGFEEHDDMLPQAIECLVEAGQASTSFLQRKLKLGYARAARIMDELEQRGIIGPAEGSKPRQVLLTRAQWMEMKVRNEK